LQQEWWNGKTTTTNRRSTKMSTTFCVFLLTDFSHKLILQLQIRGTWKRQTDRVGEFIQVRLHPRSGPGSKRKNRARSECSAPASCGAALAVRLSANHRPVAGHWHFAQEVQSDRTAVGFFFVGPVRAPPEISCVGSAQTLNYDVTPLSCAEE